MSNGDRLHARFDRVGGEQDKVVAYTGCPQVSICKVVKTASLLTNCTGKHLIHGGTLFHIAPLPECRTHVLIRSKPTRGPAGFSEESSRLTVPEAAQAMEPIDLTDESKRSRMLDDSCRRRARSSEHWDGLHLHLALDKLDRRQDDRGEGAADRAAKNECVDGKLFLTTVRVNEFAVHLLRYGVLCISSAILLKNPEQGIRTLKKSDEFSAAAPTSGDDIP